VSKLKFLVKLLFLFLYINSFVNANIDFAGRTSRLVIKQNNSKLKLNNVSKITGWSQSSIVKNFGNESADQWTAEGYAGTEVIAADGSGTAGVATNLVYSNSNSLVSGIKNNSNVLLAISDGIKNNSNALLSGIKNNSNTLLFTDIKIKSSSNALLYGIKNNSNALVKIDQDNGIQNNSNALLYGIKNNSNPIVKLDIDIKNNSNALLYGIKNNSNALVKIDQDNGIQNNSNALLYGIKNNSNTLLLTDIKIKNNSNALLYGIKNNSNALVKIDQDNGIQNNSNALLYGIKNNSNLTVKLDIDIKNNSNVLLYGIKNNSNALIKLNKDIENNSNTLLYGIKNNSNVLLIIDNGIQNNSNALLYGIKNNSNALLSADSLETNSNAIVYLNSYYRYENNHITFSRESDPGAGFIRFNNGFTVDSNATVTLDTFITVSGQVNLNSTGKIRLLGSLFLGPNCTLASGGGQIDGMSNTVVLEGNLNLPENYILNITGDTIIDGNGSDLYLGAWSQISIDSNVTLTLRNMTLKNSYTNYTVAPIRPAAINSRLALDNVKVRLADNFNFDQGQLFIHNDVVFSGTYRFSYNSPAHARITSNSCLYFDQNSIFDYHPSTTNTGLIEFEDVSASMHLNGCTLQTTDTGLRLTKGQLFLDNKVTLSSQGNTRLDSVTSINSVSIGAMYRGALSPDGLHVAMGGPRSNIQIYRFDGSNFKVIADVDFGSIIAAIAWHPTGKYLAVGGSDTDTLKQLRVYRFDGTTLTEIFLENIGTGSSLVLSLDWSPNGKYLAAGIQITEGLDEQAEIRVYEFINETGLSLMASVDWGLNNSHVESIAWNKTGDYLLAGGHYRTNPPGIGNAIFVYNFIAPSLIYKDSVLWGESSQNVPNLVWHPNGENFLAVGTSPGDARIYRFNKSVEKISFIDGVAYGGATVVGVCWLKGGKYFAIGGSDSLGTKIYSFDGVNISNVLLTIDYFSQVQTVCCTPDGLYIMILGQSVSLEAYKLNFGYETSPQAFSNSIIFGNSNLGSDYDLDITLLGGAFVELSGQVFYDNVN